MLTRTQWACPTDRVCPSRVRKRTHANDIDEYRDADEPGSITNTGLVVGDAGVATVGWLTGIVGWGDCRLASFLPCLCAFLEDSVHPDFRRHVIDAQVVGPL